MTSEIKHYKMIVFFKSTFSLDGKYTFYTMLSRAANENSNSLVFYLKISKHTHCGVWGLYASCIPYQLAGETSGLS